MSESDTNPQRPEPDVRYQRPTSELPTDAPGGQSRPGGEVPADERAAAPAEASPMYQAGQPAATEPAPGQPAAGNAPSEPAADRTVPLPPAPGQPVPGQAPAGQPMQPAPQQSYWQQGQAPAAAGQAGWYGPPAPGAPGYGAPGYGAAQQPPIAQGPQQPAPQQQTPQQQTSPQQAAQQPAAEQPSDQQPSDQQGQPAPRQSTGRFGRAIAVGLLALLLAGGGGVVGGLVVHAADSSNTTGSLAAAPTVDRSTLSGIVNTVKNSVVSIQTSDAEGSGVILSADGYIVTNNHVVADATGKTVQVTFASGKTAHATIVGTDPKTDLAVVKAEGVSNLAAAKFANSDSVQVGDTVLAIGSPLGLSGTVTEGIVSALHRTIEEQPEQQQPQAPFGQQDPFGQQQQQQQSQAQTNIAGAIQTDASINPGNSGGALVNTRGEVVGINTSILTADGGDGNGVGFAIPSNRVNEVSQDLMKGQKVSHPYIGINVGTADGNAGASVTSVVSNSPAEKAGLKQGDIIVKADNADIHSSDELLDVVQSSKVGDKLQLTVSRNGSTQVVPVTVGESS